MWAGLMEIVMIGDHFNAVGHPASDAALEAYAAAAIDPARFAHFAGCCGKASMAVSAAASRVAASLSQRAPFSAVAGRGSPRTPLGAMSRVSHANVAGAFSGLSNAGCATSAMSLTV